MDAVTIVLCTGIGIVAYEGLLTIYFLAKDYPRIKKYKERTG